MADWWAEELAQSDLDSLATTDAIDDNSGRVQALITNNSVEYRVAALKIAAGPNAGYAGVALLGTAESNKVTPAYWRLSTAIATQQLAHGDAEVSFKR